MIIMNDKLSFSVVSITLILGIGLKHWCGTTCHVGMEQMHRRSLAPLSDAMFSALCLVDYT